MEPEKVTLLPKQAIKITCGLKHCTVLCKNLAVYAWGDNTLGQLGAKTEDNTSFSSIPVQVESYGSAQPWNIESGFYHTIAFSGLTPDKSPTDVQMEQILLGKENALSKEEECD